MSGIEEVFIHLENAGIQSKFIFPTVCFLILLPLGIFGNLSIIYAVLTKRPLQNVSNVLLALNAGGDIIHQSSHFVVVYFVLSGKNVTTHLNCFYYMFPFYFALDFTLCIMIWVALDRIFIVLFPLPYQKMNKPLYILFVCLSSSIYGTVLIVLAYKELVKFSETKTICIVVSIFVGNAKKAWLYSQFSMVAVCILMYVIFWLLIRKNTRLKDSTTKLVLNTVSVVVATVFICWELATIIMSLAEALGASGETLTVFIMYCGILINISCTTNYFIYFTRSTEYRAAFKEQLFMGKPKKIKVGAKTTSNNFTLT